MIYAVALITKDGRLIIARQFTHTNRAQLEGQLGAFPKLVQTTNHNYLDTESVRFVFQEVGELYVVLVVSKNSNIVQDVDTLNLIVDVTRMIAHDFNPDKILAVGLDLIFAYDECIFDGIRLPLSLTDVQESLLMKSADEEASIRAQIDKEKRAKEEMNRRIEEIRSKKTAESPGQSYTPPSFTPQSFEPSSSFTPQTYGSPPPARTSRPIKSGKSISIRKSNRGKIASKMLEEEVRATEDETIPTPSVTPDGFSGLMVAMRETYSIVLTHEGSLNDFAVSGRLSAVSTNRMTAQLALKISPDSAKFKMLASLQPDRKLFPESHRLVYDNTGSRYQPGNEANLLSWQTSIKDDTLVPFAITTTSPAQTKKSITFMVMVTVNQPELGLRALEVSIPVNDPPSVKVNSIDGDWEVEDDQTIKWTIAPGEDEYQIEFVAAKQDESEFFPIRLQFDADKIMFNASLESVQAGDDAVSFQVVTNSSAKKFEVEYSD